MLHNKQTPNELAKLEVYDRVLSARYDGAKAEYPRAIDKEAVDKHTWWLYTLLGMDKIYDKIES